MLVSESKSFPASEALWADVAAPRYMLLVRMMSVRDETEVKSGVQKIVVVGKHGGRGARNVGREGDQREPRSAGGWWWLWKEREGEDRC